MKKKIKRTLGFFMSLVMLISMTSLPMAVNAAAVEDAVIISVSDVKGAVGEQVTVTVSIQPNTTDEIYALGIYFTYDVTKLTFVTGSAVKPANTVIPGSWSGSPSGKTAGKVKYGGASADDALTEAGVLFVAKFTILAALAGSTPLTMVIDQVIDYDGVELLRTPVNGSVSDMGTINFASNNGTSVSPATGLIGTVNSSLPALTQDGKNFLGWCSDEALTTIVTEATYTAADITLYAKWEDAGPTTATITFNSNGGSPVNQVVDDINASIPKPTPDPELAGYTFTGWFLDTNLTTPIQWDYTLTADVTFYAGWSANTNTHYTVEHYKQNLAKDSFVKDDAATQDLTGTTDTIAYAWELAFEGFTVDWNAIGTVASGTIYADGSQVLKVYYTRNECTVTFNANGGTVDPGTSTVVYGAAFDTGSWPTPVLENNTFNGWFTAQTGGTEVQSTDVCTASQELFAQWTSNESTITFNANGGTVEPATSVVNTGSTFGSGTGGWPTPVLTNYVFDGWFTAQAGGIKVESTDVCGATQELFAHWTGSPYDIVFEAGAGSGTMANQTINFGEKQALASNAFTAPTGFAFDGWKDSLGTAYAESADFTMSTEGATLTAQWKVQSYQIYYYDGLGFQFGEPLTFEYGETIVDPVGTPPVPVGNHFTGWEAHMDTMPAGGFNVDAEYAPNTYQVIFEANGGTGTMDPQDIQYGDSSNLTANAFVKTGYTFDGWKDGSGTSFADQANYAMASEGVTMTAQWTAKPYDVTFLHGDGTGVNYTQSIYFDDTQALVPNTFTAPTGFAFDGWKDSLGTAYAEGADFTMSTEGAVLTAQWKVQSYQVYYYDGLGVQFGEPLTFEYGETIVDPAGTPPVPVGNYFTGWEAHSATMPAGGFNVDAEYAPNTYQVTFAANGGTGTMAQQDIQYGESSNLTANVFVKTGYTFDGWKDGSGTSFVDGYNYTMATEGVTMTAQWVADPYTLTFDAEGGTVDPATSTVSFDVTYGGGTGGFPTPVLAGFSFEGWFDGDDGTGTQIYTDTAFATTANVTLHAKWAEIVILTSTVSFELNGGLPVIASADYTVGDTLAKPTDPTKANMFFAGWFLDATFDTAVAWPYTVTASNVTMYAKWTSYGDLNQSGTWDSQDARLLLSYLTNKGTLTPEQLLAADVNHDGKLNSRDVLMILQAASGYYSL